MIQVFWDFYTMLIGKYGITSQIICIFIKTSVRVSNLSKNKMITLQLCYIAAVNAVSTDLIFTVLSAVYSGNNSSACEQILVYSSVPDWLWHYGLCTVFCLSSIFQTSNDCSCYVPFI
jgi:hypothetical protein